VKSFVDLQEAFEGAELTCPTSDYWNNESPHSLVRIHLLFGELAQCKRVVIEPFYHLECFICNANTGWVRCVVVSKNQIDLLNVRAIEIAADI
jgi:hypothetical protein